MYSHTLFLGIWLKSDHDWIQGNSSYAPLREVAGPSQAQTGIGFRADQPDQHQVFNAPVTESLRYLAGNYVNNPESLVCGVQLEPTPSGRFRVVITLETGGIL
jgi:hypothetical protein